MNLCIPSVRPAHGAGFSLLELLVALAVAGVLASIAYPTFAAQVTKARRIDAIVALSAAQMAQERWRAQKSSYGDLADIGVASLSSAGHYALRITASSAAGYAIVATAQGAQAGDTDCRHLRLEVAGNQLGHASGPDATVANPAALNRRCWSL